MTLTPQVITDELKRLYPNSFTELMAGLLTIILIIFVCIGLTLQREISAELWGITGVSIGYWFKSR